MELLDLAYNYQKSFIQNPSKRKIWVSSRQIGKSWTLAFILCQKALSKKNGLSLCISTGSRAASEIIKKCGLFAEAIKKLSNNKIDYTSSFDSIKFNNGCRVLSLPSSTDGSNLRGFTAQCVCIDEAAFIPHLDVILQAISPTLTRDKNAELIFATTPAGKNGKFYNIYKDGEYNNDWYIQHTTIYDAINDGLDIDLEAIKSLCPDSETFEQEYCCKFLNEYGSLIDTNIIDWYEDDNITGIPFFGMDVGSTGDRSVITICKQNRDKTYLDDIIIMNKISYEEQLEIVRQANEKYKFKCGYVDKTGIGDSLSEFISKQVNSNIKGLNFTLSNKTPMYEYLRSQIFHHKLYINKKFQAKIIADFNNVQRIISENGQIKYQANRDKNGHSDITSSLVLCLNSIRENPISISEPISFGYNSKFNHWHSRL